MASDKHSKIVLLTGVNSFFASSVAGHLLKSGYTVRGTVRAREKADRLLEGPWKQYGSKVQIYEVPDITTPTAWDESVKGVSAIIHSAGPVITPAITKPSEVIVPIIQSTQHLLESATNHAGSQLELFAFTSSVAAAITPGQQAPHTYTEDSWNTVAPAIIDKEGDDASVWHSYPVAKYKAEKYCWEFHKTRKPSFAITALCGSIATGPPQLLPSTPDLLPMTLRPVFNGLVGRNIPSAQDTIARIAGAAPYSDIRDVARVYEWCIENPRLADGQRYLVVAGHGAKQALLDILREAYPERENVIPFGENGKEGVGQGYRRDWRFEEGGVKFDARKVESATGIEWIPYDRSILDTAEALRPLWEGLKGEEEKGEGK